MDARHKREYPGERESAELVRWLNANELPGIPRRFSRRAQVVGRLIERIQELWRNSDSSVANKVNADFKRHFQVYPSIVGLATRAGKTERMHFHLSAKDAMGMVGTAIMQLGNMGVIDQLRRCRVPAKGWERECGRWFFSVQGAVFCSEGCRDWYYQSSEQYKPQRREQKRRLRENERLENAGFEKPAKRWKGKVKHAKAKKA